MREFDGATLRVGDYAVHPDVPGLVQIRAIWRWPITYAEVVTDGGVRFAAPVSELSAVDYGFEAAA